MLLINSKLIFMIFDLCICVLRKLCLLQDHKIFLTFSSRSFILSDFRYRSMPHLAITFCICHETRVQFHIFSWIPRCFSTNCWKTFPFPIEIWFFYQNSIDHMSIDHTWSISGLSVLFHGSICLSSSQYYTISILVAW